MISLDLPTAERTTRPRSRPRHVRWAAVVAALLVIGTAGAASQGAEGFSIALSPSQVVMEGVPGATAVQTVTIYNNGPEPVQLRVGTGDFLLDDPDASALTFSVAGWVRTDVTRLLIPSAERRQVEVIADIPAGAAPGGYQAGLFVMTAPTGGEATRAAGRIMAAVLLEIPRDDRPLRRELEVTDHHLDVEFPPGLSLESLFSPTLRTETAVSNRGETFVRAMAVDSYHAWARAGTTTREAPGATIMRGAGGRFTTEARPMPWIGPVTVTTDVVYEIEAGTYGHIVVEASEFVVPWRLLLLLGSAASAILGTILLRRRRRRVARVAARATAPGRSP